MQTLFFFDVFATTKQLSVHFDKMYNVKKYNKLFPHIKSVMYFLAKKDRGYHQNDLGFELFYRDSILGFPIKLGIMV